MKTRTIKQTIILAATPHEIFEMWMDSEKHAQITGSAAEIGRYVGSEFSTFDNYSTGQTLELVADKKIVQIWGASDWPPDHYSTLTLELTAVNGKTKLVFTQKGVPEDQYEEIRQGWYDYYWDRLKEIFAERSTDTR